MPPCTTIIPIKYPKIQPAPTLPPRTLQWTHTPITSNNTPHCHPKNLIHTRTVLKRQLQIPPTPLPSLQPLSNSLFDHLTSCLNRREPRLLFVSTVVNGRAVWGLNEGVEFGAAGEARLDGVRLWLLSRHGLWWWNLGLVAVSFCG